jgi:branched-chain amino acid aminotransferase
MSLNISMERRPDPADAEQVQDILANPGFGTYFTDHMLLAEWTPETGWGEARITAYGPLTLDPATAVLHYAQEVFEGLKAYRHDDGSVWMFRPEANGARMMRSSRRLALPELSVDDFVSSVEALVRVDERWVPSPEGERSLYLRPFMFASERFLGVRPSKHVTYGVIASPAGSYFPSGMKPVSLMVSENFTRAAVGGMGAAKTGGNYASSLAPQQEAIDKGFDQVVFLDALERKYVEELGGMNLYFVHDDGTIVTPELTGTILEGVTRSSIIQLSDTFGHKVEERRFAIEEWHDGIESGRITEVFACGTAAVITPVGRVAWHGGEMECAPSGDAGPVTTEVRQALIDIQYGRAEDPFGWLHQVV